MEGQRRLFGVVLRRVELRIVLVVFPSRKLSLRVWRIVSVGLCLVLQVGESVVVHIDLPPLPPLVPSPYPLYYPPVLPVVLPGVLQTPLPVQKDCLRNRNRLQKAPPRDTPPVL